MTWQQYIHQHSTEIASIFGEDEAIAILKRIAEHICATPYSILKQTTLSDEDLREANVMLNELKEGRPLQYVLGEAWFYKYPFKVNEAVLIPRPETEELIEWILSYMNKELNKDRIPEILDIGTGSGCIPITIKKEKPKTYITSVDISREALAMAEANTRQLKTEIKILELDFLNESSWGSLNKYDIIVSNPPYIAINEKETLSVSVRNHEPHQALFVPENQPLLFYEKIAKFGKVHLKKSGVIFLELHQNYALRTKKLFEEFGYTEVELRKDISGNERMLKVCK